MKAPTIDQIDEKIRQFMRRNNQKLGSHNTYYIYSENMDGDVTGEAYAVNELTNAGLKWCVYTDFVNSSEERYGSPGTINSVRTSSGGSITDAGTLRLGTEWPSGSGTGTPTDPAFAGMYSSTFISVPLELRRWDSFNSRNNTNYAGYSESVDLYCTSTHVYGVVRKFYAVTEYNYSGVTSALNIQEIGLQSISSNSSNFTLHARVVDETGQPSYIVKNPNEKLTIYVYTSYGVPISVMKNGYDAGWNGSTWKLQNATFAFVNPQTFKAFYNNYLPCYYCNNHGIVGDMEIHGSTSTSSYFLHMLEANDRSSMWYMYYNNSFMPDDYQVNHVSESPRILLEDNHQYIDSYRGNIGMTDAVYSDSSGDRYGELCITKYFETDTTDTLVTNLGCARYTSDTSYYNAGYYWGNLNIRHLFGEQYRPQYARGILPTSYCTIKKIQMYNIKTHAFDINETFSSHNDFYYRDYWSTNNRHYGRASMKFPNGTFVSRALIYTNPNPQYAITSFGGTYTAIYATDSWWDVSTWQIIPEYTNVPAALSKKRYYITDNTYMYPYWDDAEPKIIPMTQKKQLNFTTTIYSSSDTYKLKPILVNESERYIVTFYEAIFMDENMDKISSYILSGYDDATIPQGTSSEENGPMSIYRRMFYQNKFCMFINERLNYSTIGNASKCRIYDFTNRTSPTHVDLIIDTNPNKTDKYIFVDWDMMNHSRWIVVCDNVANASGKICTQVIDLSQTLNSITPVEIEDAANPYLIRNSNYIIYRDATVTTANPTFHIYNLISNAVVKTIQFPAGYDGTHVGCFAYSTDGTLPNTHIYITLKNTSSNVSTKYYVNGDSNIPAPTTLTPNTNTFTIPTSDNIVNGIGYVNMNQSFGCKDCGMYVVGWNNSNYSTTDPILGTSLLVYDPNDPLNEYIVGGYACTHIPSLRYINDGKQLIYTKSAIYNSNNSNMGKCCVLDIGHLMATHEHNVVYQETTSSNPYRTSDCVPLTSTRCWSVPYGKGLIELLKTETNVYNFYYTPIEYAIPHRIEVQTKQVQAYNNPIAISGIQMKTAFTNLADRTTPVE